MRKMWKIRDNWKPAFCKAGKKKKPIEYIEGYKTGWKRKFGAEFNLK